VTKGVRRASYEGTGALVTKTLIGLNVLIYLVTVAQGGGINAPGGPLFEHAALFIERQLSDGSIGGLAHGEWWRLITAAFLHGGLIHLVMNMLILWLVGGPIEASLGRGRFLALYVVSGIAGSAGALLLDPNAVTVGASGAICGLFGAALVAERLGTCGLGGSVVGLVVFIFVFTIYGASAFNISVGGHVGGFVGGALAMLALWRFGRGHAVYGRPGLVGVVGVIAVGALSVLVAWARVRGYAA